MTWLEDLHATPAEVAALDQALAEVQAAEDQQRGDDDNGGAGPWDDSAPPAGGNDHD